MASNTQRIFGIVQGTLNSLAGRALRLRTPLFVLVSLGSAGALFRAYLFDWGMSSGPSMYPTQPDEPHLLVTDVRCRRGRGLRVGDVVQAVHPQFPGYLVGKRVIGMPGDYVVKSRAMSSAVGGVPVKGITDWNKSETEEPPREEPEMIQVPEGHVWVEGDNLGWSRDSRVYGPMPMALIKARSAVIAEGLFSYKSLRPGKGLRKVEDWEMDAVLGEGEGDSTTQAKRERQSVAGKNMSVDSLSRVTD